MMNLNSTSYYWLLLLLFFDNGLSGTSAQLLKATCSSSNYSSTTSTYPDSLRELASSLRNASMFSLYSNASSTASTRGDAAVAKGMFQCRGDLSPEDCFVCVNSTLDIAMNQECPASIGANVAQVSCHVRYNSAPFYSSSLDASVWFSQYNSPNPNTNATFQSDIETAVEKATESAPANPNYYASSHEGSVYAQAQCDGYLSPLECRSCLSSASNVLTYFNSSPGGRTYYGSCFYRYETYPFFQNTPSSLALPPAPSSPPSPVSNYLSPPPSSLTDSGNHSSSSVSIAGVIAGVIVSAVVIVGLFICALVFCCSKRKTLLPTQIQVGMGLLLGDDHVTDPVTRFSLEELVTATQNFHSDNKIGEGGFGSVYKGKLVNGKEVAIKKLSATSHQGEREFLNEVRLITSVRHRNLIKLYGCCLEGPERLLVYEYLPNKSLDKFLFDYEEGGGSSLDWKTRLDIIRGTARGLDYLHQDSQICIIHRDIKASNILLDSDLTPKIADFGLARPFSHNASHVTTGVAGTYGYISPEYLLRRKLTVKADVYSFGIVTLEIICGRKHYDSQQPPEKENLVDWVWKCYQEREQMQLLDPRLSNMMNPPVEVEVVQVIHVALLCLQANVKDRPSMMKVVQMLGGQSQTLETPNMPQYVCSIPDDGENTTHQDILLPNSTQCSNSNVTAR